MTAPVQADTDPPVNEHAPGGEHGGAKSGVADRPISSSIPQPPDNVNSSPRRRR